MSSRQERQSGGWERRRATFSSLYYLGAVATAAAALTAGLITAPSASSAQFSADRIGNVVPIGAANPCDDPTISKDLWVEVMKSRTAHPDEVAELGLLAFSCDQKPLNNAQVLITPEVGSPAEFTFPRRESPVAIGGGEVWPSKEYPADYNIRSIEWFLRTSSKKPEGLKLKLIIPANFLGRLCLGLIAFAPSTRIIKSVICWNVTKTPKITKTNSVKPLNRLVEFF